MSRLSRRLEILRQTQLEARFDPDQHFIEAALRGRTARKVRTHLRRMEPLVLLTPRWSRPQGFLEDIALDLAVGEPAVGCRTVSFRPLKGRSTAEAWNFMLGVFQQMLWKQPGLPMMVAGRRGFHTAAMDLLKRTQDECPDRVALLAHGAENLPIDALEDLSEIWARFADMTPTDRRATILVAGSIDASVHLAEAGRLQLQDYGEAEAAAAIIGRSGPAPRANLESAARFSGGIPAVVEALGRGSRDHGGVPRSRAGLVRALGPLAEEIRFAIDIANADSMLSDRLEQLLSGEPLLEVPEVDKPLMMAGLLRRVRMPGEDRVLLRAPAIGAIVT